MRHTLLLAAAFLLLTGFTGKRDGASLYEMLGVTETATDPELRAAVRAAGAELGPGRPKAFDIVGEAAGVLSDPVLRKLYDGYLADTRKSKTSGDGQYQLELFRAYRRFILARTGSEDPAGFDHATAFSVFAPMHAARNQPRALARKRQWEQDDGRGSACGTLVGKLFRVHAVAAAAAAALLVSGHDLSRSLPSPLTPAEIRPAGFRPEPATELPKVEAGVKAARRAGEKFAAEPPRD